MSKSKHDTHKEQLTFIDSAKCGGFSLPSNVGNWKQAESSVLTNQKPSSRGKNSGFKRPPVAHLLLGEDSFDIFESDLQLLSPKARASLEKKHSESAVYTSREHSLTDDDTNSEVSFERLYQEVEEDDVFGIVGSFTKVGGREKLQESLKLEEKKIREYGDFSDNFVPPHLLVRRESQSLFERPCPRRMINWT
eukprot:ctg_686.g367